MWQTVESNTEPSEFDSSTSKFYVYQRRNIEKFTSADDENPDFWRYEELKIPRAVFDAHRIKNLEDENTQLQLAIVELYEALI